MIDGGAAQALEKGSFPDSKQVDARAILRDRQALWDWRRRVSELYAVVRSSEPEAGWRQWRAQRDELFRDHPQSPVDVAQRLTFRGLPYYDYDPSLRCLVTLDEPDELRPVSMAVGTDGAITLQPFARTRGLEPRCGTELTLYWISGYGGGVFLPFRDATNGTETFGAGRYLLDTIKGADLGCTEDGRTILDFNFAYNPSCSYSELWVCPLAPLENSIPRPLLAGERMSGPGA